MAYSYFNKSKLLENPNGISELTITEQTIHVYMYLSLFYFINSFSVAEKCI